jgi:hypothetical protein
MHSVSASPFTHIKLFDIVVPLGYNFRMSDSSLIGKVEKAHRYAADRSRFTFLNFQVVVRGDNGDHVVSYDHGQWSCNSDYFKHHGYDSHTMAVEKLLEGMLEEKVASK